jgi:hypothetical protein
LVLVGEFGCDADGKEVVFRRFYVLRSGWIDRDGVGELVLIGLFPGVTLVVEGDLEGIGLEVVI